MAIFGGYPVYSVWDTKKTSYPFGAITPANRVTNIRQQVDENVYGEYLYKKDFWLQQPVQRWRFKSAAYRDKFCKNFNGTPY